MLLPRRVERGPASPPSYRAIPPWVVPDLPQAPQPPAEYLDDFGLAARRIVMDSPSPGSDGLLGRQGCLRRGHPGLDRGHGDRDGRRDRRRREPDGDGARSARRLPLRRDAGTRSTQPDGGAITVVSPDAIPALAGARPGGVALGLLFRVRVSVLLALGVAAWYLAPTELVEGHLRRLAGHPPASDRPGPPLDSPARPGASGGEPDARRAAPGRAPPRDYERRRDRRIRGHAGLGYVCPDGCRRAELGAPGLPSWVSLEPSRGRRDVAPSSQPGSSDSGRSLVGLAQAEPPAAWRWRRADDFPTRGRWANGSRGWRLTRPERGRNLVMLELTLPGLVDGSRRTKRGMYKPCVLRKGPARRSPPGLRHRQVD